jgi:hypothetical protein
MKKMKNLLKTRLCVMMEPALQFVSQRLTGRSRVFRMLGIVILALIINGLIISVIGTLCLGASEPIWCLLEKIFNCFLLSSETFSLCTLGLVPSSPESRKLDPWFVTGFADGEACFTVTIRKYPKLKIGWSVEPRFDIELHIRNIDLLEKIHAFFGVGKIQIKKDRGTVVYSVLSVKDLTSAIIPHFCKYPLLTQKGADFELFKMIIDLINSKEHRTIEGIHKIVSIRGSLNWGLTPTLVEAFPDIAPIARPLIKCTEIPDPYWLTGFVEGEGCFEIGISKSIAHRTGSRVQLRMTITQDSRDTVLMDSLIKYLKCGFTVCSKYSTKVFVRFIVSSTEDINTEIIPLFNKYPFQGPKLLDYVDWCKGVEIIKAKGHLTEEGVGQLEIIKKGMNRGR